MVSTGTPPVVEAGSPDWMRRYALRCLDYFLPRVAQGPIKVKEYATADLPPAASYPYTIAFDTTLGTLVASDGTNWVSL